MRGRAMVSLALMAATSLLTVPATTAADAAPAEHRVPFKAVDRGTFTTTPLDDGRVFTEDTAHGRGTHVGAYDLHASEVIDLATLAVTDGSFTVTAANGDTLSGSYEGTASGTSDPQVITYHVQGPVSGGTGRFVGTHGWLVWDGVANLGTGVLSDRVSGWIVLRSRG